MRTHCFSQSFRHCGASAHHGEHSWGHCACTRRGDTFDYRSRRADTAASREALADVRIAAMCLGHILAGELTRHRAWASFDVAPTLPALGVRAFKALTAYSGPYTARRPLVALLIQKSYPRCRGGALAATGARKGRAGGHMNFAKPEKLPHATPQTHPCASTQRRPVGGGGVSQELCAAARTAHLVDTMQALGHSGELVASAYRA
eukprot:gnl/Chilomastix_cuspidata/8436.p1 GENE.gnl/Chilomastix_cuspidata/8436~~gnl/Chilomastix_cuspidata/8436.p1  ORF type:complete len:205 (+),score=15.42 gnl/Chilomastix_cuspidata/8436:559-1173(+)